MIIDSHIALSASDADTSPSAGRAGAAIYEAQHVARGVTRLFARHAIWMLPEFNLPNKRRADLIGMDKGGNIVIVEIKVAKSDLLGDKKWTDYLEYCDQFYWALAPNLDSNIVNGELFLPERTGLIVADSYDAEVLRPARRNALASARRTKTLKLLGAAALQRNAMQNDPHILDINES